MFGGLALRKLKIAAVSASGLALALQPAPSASATVADGQDGAMMVTSSVASFYDTFHSQPIWFRAGPNAAAIAQLTAILQRAPFDGFPEGPALAAQVQAAAARANSGKPEDVAEAEHLLSSAWVAYVQAIKLSLIHI